MSEPAGRAFRALDRKFDRYVFARAGDEIPLHVHPDRDHLTVAVVGRVEAFFESGAPVEVKFDTPMLFAAGTPHGIRALTDGAVVLQVSR